MSRRHVCAILRGGPIDPSGHGGSGSLRLARLGGGDGRPASRKVPGTDALGRVVVSGTVPRFLSTGSVMSASPGTRHV